MPRLYNLRRGAVQRRRHICSIQSTFSPQLLPAITISPSPPSIGSFLIPKSHLNFSMPFWYLVPSWLFVVLWQDFHVYWSLPLGNVYAWMEGLFSNLRWRVLIWSIDKCHTLQWLERCRRSSCLGLCAALSELTAWMRIHSSSTPMRKACARQSPNEGRNGLAWLGFIINSSTGSQQWNAGINYWNTMLASFFSSLFDGNGPWLTLVFFFRFVRFGAGLWSIGVLFSSYIYLRHISHYLLSSHFPSPELKLPTSYCSTTSAPEQFWSHSYSSPPACSYLFSASTLSSWSSASSSTNSLFWVCR